MIHRPQVAALLGLLLLTHCAQDAAPEPSNRASPAPESASVPTRIRWVNPASAQDATLAEAPARVLIPPDARVAIATPFPTRVATVQVRSGEHVQKDQLLMEVLMPEVVRASGALLAAYTRVQAYQKQVTQLTALQTQGMTRLSELGEAQTRLAEARAEVQAHTAILRSAGLAPGEAADIASRGLVQLRSPIEGRVVELNASPGELSGTGDPVLARIASEAGGDRVEARLPQEPPSDATFQYLPPIGPPVPLRLIGRAPGMDPRDATVTAWFGFEEPTRHLSGGQTGRVVVKAGETLTALKVPARALRFIEGQPHVYLRGSDEEEPQPLAVSVVALTGADALVRAEGLSPTSGVAADASVFDVAGEGHHHD